MMKLALWALAFLCLPSVVLADNGKCGDHHLKDDALFCLVDTLSWVEVTYVLEDTIDILERPKSHFESIVRKQVKKHMPYLAHEVVYYDVYDIDFQVDIRDSTKTKDLHRKGYIGCTLMAIESDRVAYHVDCRLWSWLHRGEFNEASYQAAELGMSYKQNALRRVEEAFGRLIDDLSLQLAESQVKLELESKARQQ